MNPPIDLLLRMLGRYAGIFFRYTMVKNAAERVYELAHKEFRELLKAYSKSKLDKEDFRMLIEQLREKLVAAQSALVKKRNPFSNKVFEFHVKLQ